MEKWLLERRKRIEELKALIGGGEYVIEDMRVADAILAFHEPRTRTRRRNRRDVLGSSEIPDQGS